MSEANRCLQCLLCSSIDCLEPECPGEIPGEVHFIPPKKSRGAEPADAEAGFNAWWEQRCATPATHKISLKQAMLDAFLAGIEHAKKEGQR